MDAEIVKAIDGAQAAINEACLRTAGLNIEERTQIEVKDYQTLEDIATMLFGDDGWRSIEIDSFGGFTFSSVTTPEGVRYFNQRQINNEVIAALDELAVS